MSDRLDKEINKLKMIGIDMEIYRDEKILLAKVRLLNPIKRIVIPDGIHYLGMECFKGLEIEEVVCPETLININGGCFEECRQLRRIRLNDGLQRIGGNAFHGCWNLESIELPETVDYLGSHCFESCEGLKRVKVSNNIIEIEDHTFYNCTRLKDISLPDNVTKLGNRVFALCNKLETVRMGKVQKVGCDLFGFCSELKEVRADLNIEEAKELFGLGRFNTFYEVAGAVRLILNDSEYLIETQGKRQIVCKLSKSEVDRIV